MLDFCTTVLVLFIVKSCGRGLEASSDDEKYSLLSYSSFIDGSSFSYKILMMLT